MKPDQNQGTNPAPISRRDWLCGSLLAGVGVTLWGCQAPGGSTGGRLPGPVWPDMEPSAGGPIAAAPTPDVPPTQPMPVNPGVPAGIIPRGTWTNASPIISRSHPMNGISRITIHHSAIPNDTLRSQADVVRMLRGIQREHMNRAGEPFADIGYHYIIDPSGRIWEGRTTALQGAHVANQNEHNLGVMLLGHFDRQQPTQASVATLDSFVTAQMHRYNVPVGRVYTHQEIGRSACPGRNLQRYMDQTRSRGTLARA